MLAICAFVRQWGWSLAVLALGGLMMFTLARRTASFRERRDAAFLRLPLIGRLARGYKAARFGITLAMLAGAGVQILKALQAAAETLGNRAHAQRRAGRPGASAQRRAVGVCMGGKNRVQGLLSMSARLGEMTGQLALMLQRASV